MMKLSGKIGKLGMFGIAASMVATMGLVGASHAATLVRTQPATPGHGHVAENLKKPSSPSNYHVYAVVDGAVTEWMGTLGSFWTIDVGGAGQVAPAAAITVTVSQGDCNPTLSVTSGTGAAGSSLSGEQENKTGLFSATTEAVSVLTAVASCSLSYP